MRILTAFVAAIAIMAAVSTAKADTWFQPLSSYQITATLTELTDTISLNCGFVAITKDSACQPSRFFRVAFLDAETGYVGFYSTPYEVGISGLATKLSASIYLNANESAIIIAPRQGGIIAIHANSLGTVHITELNPVNFGR